MIIKEFFTILSEYSNIDINFLFTGTNGAGIFLDEQSNPIVNIGGSSENDIDNFNEFINNYKTGNNPLPDNHIVNNVYGDCHMDYPYNYYTPDNLRPDAPRCMN